MSDPLGAFAHDHGHLSKLAMAIGPRLRDDRGSPRVLDATHRREVFALLERLRDELLRHFADEEEALFPFVRSILPGKAEAVDRLEASHDAICGAVVRMAHLADHRGDGQLLALYERFEASYARHSHDEAHLFDELKVKLAPGDREELAARMRGISAR